MKMSLASIVAHPVVSATGHTLSLATIVTAFAGLVPTVAAIFAVIWYIIEIAESKSGQAFFANLKARFASAEATAAQDAGVVAAAGVIEAEKAVAAVETEVKAATDAQPQSPVA